ncbi:MAG: ABC transporter ATP-binding protein [Tissierellia bacterium]|nr:ABC transporter ATP-binding protein [Tissierellia bacterium]
MIVEVKNVLKRYDELTALDHFSIDVAEGEIYGLLGPNGSGKTTAIHCMLSLLKYEKGEILLFGEPIGPTKYDLKRRIGVVPQEVSLMYELTVQENIDFFCGLYVTDKTRRQKLVENAMEFVAIQEFRKFYPNKLSGGLKRRLNIACGIAHQPELIFFDEPTVAVDPQSRNNILEGIRRLNEEGATIIYTSHYMEEVEQLCNRISIMDKGRVLITGSKEELKESVGLKDKLIVSQIDIAQDALTEIQDMVEVSSVFYEGEELTVNIDKNRAIGEVINYLDHQGMYYGKLSIKQPTLNDVFLEITGKELRQRV